MKQTIKLAALWLLLGSMTTGSAQQTTTPLYGPPITLEAARKAVAAAIKKAEQNHWPMVIVVVDSAAQPVLLERMDQTQYGSIEVAIAKARTAVNFKRPSGAMQDTLASGGAGLRMLAIPGVMPIEGGLPLIIAGQLVGAIGVSGMAPDQDGVVARAGAEALAMMN